MGEWTMDGWLELISISIDRANDRRSLQEICTEQRLSIVASRPPKPLHSSAERWTGCLGSEEAHSLQSSGCVVCLWCVLAAQAARLKGQAHSLAFSCL